MPEVVVVQPAHYSHLVNVPDALYLSRSRRILADAQVGSSRAVVADVFLQNHPQMVLIQHNHVVDALTPEAPDQSLDVPILPGPYLFCDHFLCSPKSRFL